MSELSIKVNIANRVYPLTVLREEEEEVRSAAAYINERLKALAGDFAVKDKLDLLAMLALELCIEKGHGKQTHIESNTARKVVDLIEMIDRTLESR
ncbi:MAG: hypothetical protein Kow0075_07260 [Salibacteraceae bacterium]